MDAGKEQSSILQTTLFDNFYSLKTMVWQLAKPSNVWRSVVQFKEDFIEFRSDPDRSKYRM